MALSAAAASEEAAKPADTAQRNRSGSGHNSNSLGPAENWPREQYEHAGGLSQPDGQLQLQQSVAVDPYFAKISAFQQSMIDAMRNLMAYRLIPDSGKMVVFDSRLPISDALNGLLHHDINCAPVWDSVARRYIGMLTVSDYIDILRHSYSQQDSAAMDENRRICDWQSIKRMRGTSIDRLLYISPESSLYEAVEMLTRYRIHRICVLQNGALANTVLSILSQHAILGYMLGVHPELQEFDLPLRVLPLGQLHDVCTVTYDTSVIRALDLLNAFQISTLPIVNDEGYLIDSYSRSDAKYLALIRHPDLDMSLRETLSAIRNIPALHTCTPKDSLWEICNLMLESGAHTVLCVTEDSSAESHPGESGMASASEVGDPSERGAQCKLVHKVPRLRVQRMITITEVLCFLIARPGTKSYFRPEDTLHVGAQLSEDFQQQLQLTAADPDSALQFQQQPQQQQQQPQMQELQQTQTGFPIPVQHLQRHQQERQQQLQQQQQQYQQAAISQFSVPPFSPPLELSRQFSHISQYLPPDQQQLYHQQLHYAHLPPAYAVQADYHHAHAPQHGAEFSDHSEDELGFH